MKLHEISFRLSGLIAVALLAFVVGFLLCLATVKSPDEHDTDFEVASAMMQLARGVASSAHKSSKAIESESLDEIQELLESNRRIMASYLEMRAAYLEEHGDQSPPKYRNDDHVFERITDYFNNNQQLSRPALGQENTNAQTPE